MQHIAHGYTETSPVQVFQFYCFRHFVVPALSSGLKYNLEFQAGLLTYLSVSGTFPTNRSVAFVAVMGATAHPETISGEIQQRDCPGISPVFPIKSDSTDTQILIAKIVFDYKNAKNSQLLFLNFAANEQVRPIL